MQIIFTWFFFPSDFCQGPLAHLQPKSGLGNLTSTDLQIVFFWPPHFGRKSCCNFLAPPIHVTLTLCQFSSHTCFCTLLLNNILHITFSAFHWSWIYMWIKTQQKSLKKSHCGFWPVAGPGVCAPTDHYDGTGAIPRGGPARPDAHQPLQPQRW